MKLRNKLLTPNAEPKSYWTRENGSNHIKKVIPVRGNTLFLDHQMPSRISSVNLRTLHNSFRRLYSKHFLVRKAGKLLVLVTDNISY